MGYDPNEPTQGPQEPLRPGQPPYSPYGSYGQPQQLPTGNVPPPYGPQYSPPPYRQPPYQQPPYGQPQYGVPNYAQPLQQQPKTITIAGRSVPAPDQQSFVTAAQAVDASIGPVSNFSVRPNSSDTSHLTVTVTRGSQTYDVHLTLAQLGGSWKITSMDGI